MSRWKKLLLLLLVLLLLSQIPFAYRRYKLGRLHAQILSLQSQRQADTNEDGLAEFKGVVHVHSFLGGHSTGTFQEIISAATSNQLNFVVMTEHPARDFNTAEMTLHGVHAGVLFVSGNEMSDTNGDRYLMFPVADNVGPTKVSLVAYPEDFKNWNTNNYDGIEVYNVFTNARKINPLVIAFDGLWSYHTYPDLLFATFYMRPSFNLKKWDEQIAATGKRLVATAGNDAHSNVGISLNDSSGKTLVGLKLDPYARSFHLVRLHVLLPAAKTLNEESLVGAIKGGNCFIGYDLFGATDGFRFSAFNGTDSRMMGDEIPLENGVRLRVNVPVPARIVVLRDGAALKDDEDARAIDLAVTEKGSYRVEVYLPRLPGRVGQQPWIISNPIYVR